MTITSTEKISDDIRKMISGKINEFDSDVKIVSLDISKHTISAYMDKDELPKNITIYAHHTKPVNEIKIKSKTKTIDGLKYRSLTIETGNGTDIIINLVDS